MIAKDIVKNNSSKKWATVTIGEISEVIGGGTPSSKVDEYWGGSIPWLTPKDLSGYDFRRVKSGKRNITDSGLANSSARLLPKNTVLVTSRAPIGYVALADNEIATNQGFKSLILNDGYDPDFFYYLIKYNVPNLEAVSSGTTFKEISGKAFKQIKFNVPPLPEQKAIAHILGSLDDKIELNRRMNETLEAMAQALFKDWFVDFGPTRRQMDGATDPAAIMGHAFPNDKAAALAPLFPATCAEGGLPKDWGNRPLSSVVEQQKQVVKPDQHMNKTFEHFSLPAFDKAKWPTLELGAEINSNKTAIPSNAILVSKLNPRIERIWIPKDVGNHRQICSTEFLCFKPINGFGLATVEALFRSDGMHEKMASMVTGTSSSHQRVPPKVLMQADVLLPTNIARLFENVTSPFLEKRQVNRKEN